jgi:thermitase
MPFARVDRALIGNTFRRTMGLDGQARRPRRLLASLGLAGALAMLPVMAAPASAALPAVPVPAGVRPQDGLIVKLRPGASPADVARGVGAELFRGLERGRAVLRLPASASAASLAHALAALRRDPRVAWAEANARYRAADLPNDPCLTSSSQCGALEWAPAVIGAPQAWSVTHGSAAVTVAVVDGGVDPSHPDLSGKVAIGPDFTGTPQDNCWSHGTHVAGTVAAATDNGQGVAGIGWNTRVLSIRVLSLDTTLTPPDCTGYLSDIADGIDAAVSAGARVVNLSLAGVDDSQTIRDSVNNALAHNVVVVAAAGNEAGAGDPVEYPAGMGGVISVGATDRNDRTAAFSETGGWIDIAAPGVSIVSTVPGGGYGVMTGTSMATPHVAGAAALLLAVSPGLTPREVAARLELSSDAYPGAGHDARYGRLDIARALADDGNPGYYMVASDGGIFSYGRSGFFGSTGSLHLNQPIVAMAAVPRRNGYWFVARDGGVFNYGAAGFYGSLGSQHTPAPIAAIAPLADGSGYFLVGTDGSVYPFGAASFSRPGDSPSPHVVAAAATLTGAGMWLATASGDVGTVGDAPGLGSMAGQPLNAPIVGFALTPTGNGYWLVGGDGGIFSFGDARFFGSTGGKPLNAPIVGMQTTLTGNGYWLVASDGGIFAYGDALFSGSMGGTPLNKPVVGIS